MTTSTEIRFAAMLRGTLARTAQLLLLALVPCSAALALAPPFEAATALSTDSVPIERDFNIAQSAAGKYRITLTDLGALLSVPGPAPLDSVHVLVTRGSKVVASLDGNPNKTVAVASIDFDAAPGDYTLHIVGKPGTASGSGPVGLKIANVATTLDVVNFSATLAAPQTIRTGGSSYQIAFDVPATGDYQMVLADLSFPRANTLKTAGAFLFQDGASAVTACLSIPAVPSCPTTQTATLAAGHYQLVAAGALVDPTDGGLFSVHIRSVATGAVLHSRTVDIGRVRRVSDSSFQLNAGNFTLSLKDLEFPVKLGEVAAVVTRAAQVTALANSTTADANFTVAADGTAFDVFSYATADATAAAGSYDVEVRPAAGAAALSSIEALGSSTGSPSIYTFDADIAATGTYRARFGDFQFPAALSASRVAIVQNGIVVGKTDPATGSTLSLDVPLAVGRATAIVLVKPALNGSTFAQTGGTFGLELGAVGGPQLVLDATQGVGGLVSVRKVSILQAAHYDLTVSDLGFPQAFRDLMVVISRGSQKLGTIVVGSGGSNPQGGSATLTDFDASAGNYSITLIAQPSSPANAAAYGISFVASPPAPTVTLTATPASVGAGNSTGLTWTSQGATSCTATSSPAGAWSGTKATSGTEGSAAITSATTFTLRCSDAAARTTEKSVSVTIAAAQSSGGGGGGGALDWLTLAALLLAGAARVSVLMRRRPARA
jgi:hypothetical protein